MNETTPFRGLYLIGEPIEEAHLTCGIVHDYVYFVNMIMFYTLCKGHPVTEVSSG